MTTQPSASRLEAALLVGTAFLWIVANGAAPLLPVQAHALGFTPAAIGVWTASGYATLVVGTVATERLMARLNPRTLLTGATLLCAAALALPMLDGGTNTLFPARAIGWLFLGTVIAAPRVLAASINDAPRRVRLLTRLSMMSGVGSVLGGSVSGWLLDVGGTRGLSCAMGVGMVIAAGSFAMLPTHDVAAVPEASASAGEGTMSASFTFIAIGSLAISIVAFVGRLALPLAMTLAGRSGAEVSLASALGALFALPIIALASRTQSERNMTAVMLAFAGAPAVAVGGLTLGLPWFGFVLAQTAIGLHNFGGGALLAHLVSSRASSQFVRDRQVVWLGTVVWLGGLVGYGIGGATVDHLGVPNAALAFSGVGVFGAALLAVGMYSMRPKTTDEFAR